MLQPSDDLRHLSLPRDSLYWNLLLPEEELMVLFYLVSHPTGEAEALMGVAGPEVGLITEFTGDRTRFEGDDHDNCRVGNMRLHMPKPMKVHEVMFRGEQVELDYRFEGLFDAIGFDRNPNGCPPPMGVNRLEHAGRVTGQLRFAGREIEFDTTGERDHSWGPRDWTAMHHYHWISAQAGPDLAFNAMVTLFRGQRLVNGWLWKDGELGALHTIDSDYRFLENMHPRDVELCLTDEHGRTVVATSTHEPFAEFWLPYGGADLTESAANWSIDGQHGVGIVEMLWQAGHMEQLRRSPVDHTRVLERS